MTSRLLIASLLIVGAVVPASAALGLKSASMDRCLAAAAESLPDFVGQTLQRIEGTDRKLLALRSYLRNETTLSLRWSWSNEQIARYESSPEYRNVQRELALITSQFEELSPGYTLYVNSQVRSLDTQIQRWNENESVGRAARVLAAAVGKQLTRRSCTRVADKSFIQRLKSWVPPRAPTLAAPGLSKHGQAKAFDFQIKRGEEIVAGTRSSQSFSVWDKQGWTSKLRSAVNQASSKFIGPLQIPYEPWHYEYDP